MAEETTFGIVVPTYNAAPNVDRLVRSIREQTYTSYSIVLVDQGSTDRTVEIASFYQCAVVEVPKSPYYTPPSRARNAGAVAVQGRILLHLDADMELASPELLRKLAALIDDKHQAAVIPERDVASGFWSRCKALERSCYGGTEMEAARAVTRALFERVGGYDQDISSGEDYFVTRLYEQNTQIIRADSLLLLHHTGSFSLPSLLRKKYNYGRSAKTYLLKAKTIRGRSAIAIVQRSLEAYFKNWRLLFQHPALYACIFPLRAMEMFAIRLGMWSGPPTAIEPRQPSPVSMQDSIPSHPDLKDKSG